MFPQWLIMITTLTVLELNGLAIYAGFGRMIRAWLNTPLKARLFNIAIGMIIITAGTAAIVLSSGHMSPHA